MPKNMKSKDIEKWVKGVQYLLNEPEVFTPEMNCVLHDWESEKANAEKPTYAFWSLVPYSAFVANLGVSILYEELNKKRGMIAERCYYPEPKMRRRMVKEGVPLFTKESFHQIKDFEVVGFSSYYPLQFFGIPDCLTMAGMEPYAKDRKEEDPIVLMGGVAAFNPSPVAPFIDAFCLGDGEVVLADTVQCIHDMRHEGKTKAEILLYLQSNPDKFPGVYVPSLYEETYFPADDPEHPNEVKEHRPLVEGIPVRIKKSICEISQVPMLRNILVSNSEGQEMSMGSGEITRGCGHASCHASTKLLTTEGFKAINTISDKDLVYSVSPDGTLLAEKQRGAWISGHKETHLYRIGNSNMTVRATPDHRFALKDFAGEAYKGSYAEAQDAVANHEALYNIPLYIGSFNREAFLTAVIASDFNCKRFSYKNGKKGGPCCNADVRWLSDKPICCWMQDNTSNYHCDHGERNGKKTTRLRYRANSEIRNIIETYIGPKDSLEKCPSLEVTPETAASYIFGLMCTDFASHGDGTYNVGSICKAYQEKLGAILTMAGIRWTYRLNHNHGKCHDVHWCCINKKEASKLKAIYDTFKHIVDPCIDFSKVDPADCDTFLYDLGEPEVIDVWDVETPINKNWIIEGSSVLHNCAFCTDEDTPIATSEGEKKIKDITASDLILSYGDSAMFKPTDGAVLVGRKEVFEARVDNTTLRFTEDHKFRLADGSYASLREVSDKGLELYRPAFKQAEFDRESFLVGLIQADFSLTKGSRYPTFSQLSGRPAVEYLKSLNLHQTEWTCTNKQGKPALHLRFTRGYIFNLCKSVFGDFCRSSEKNPSYSLTPATAQSFIFGLMCSDMSINNKDKVISFGSTSEAANSFISNALNIAGIIHYAGKQSDRYVVRVSRRSELLKLKSISETFAEICDLDIDFNYLTDKSERSYTAKITNNLGLKDVYDMTVYDTHNYVAEGVVVHNCEGSYRSQPYRERPLDDIQSGMLDIIKNTGAKAVTPYGFNLSDHHRINDILGNLIEHSEAKISMSSQHINHFSEELARIALASGNRSITLALEAPTDEMRRRIGKGLTEETVLEKFRICFRVGFAKIKVYMVANLPLATQHDVDYLVELAKKLHEIQVEEQGDHLTTKIRFSWTPFNGKAHTPLEFAQVGPVDPETGLPIMQKTMSKVLDGLRDLGYGFRIGTDSELSAINQCMSFGDRRMSGVIFDTFKNPDFNYIGGMSIGLRKPMADFQKILTAHGLSYAEIWKEKKEDQVFSWDFINMGVTKKYLQRAYFNNYKNAIDVGRCQEKCKGCGGCTEISKKLFKQYWNHELPEGRHDLLELLEKRFKKQTVMKVRFKINVDPDYRFVHASKIKNYIRRAFFRVDAPIKNKITLASDKLRFNNWASGVDYGEVLFYSKDFDFSNIVERLNATFTDNNVMKFLQVERFSDAAGNFVEASDSVLYSFQVPFADKSKELIDSQIKKCLDADKFEIKLKVVGDKRDSFKTILVDAKPYIVDIWTVKLENSTKVYAQLREKVGVYELFPVIFGTVKRNVLKYEVNREEYLLAKDEGSMDMFAALCENSGEEIEENLFGELVSEQYCLKELTIENGKTEKERLVSSGFESDSAEEDSDELVDVGGHDDDDDDDSSNDED